MSRITISRPIAWHFVDLQVPPSDLPFDKIIDLAAREVAIGNFARADDIIWAGRAVRE